MSHRVNAVLLSIQSTLTAAETMRRALGVVSVKQFYQAEIGSRVDLLLSGEDRRERRLVELRHSEEKPARFEDGNGVGNERTAELKKNFSSTSLRAILRIPSRPWLKTVNKTQLWRWSFIFHTGICPIEDQPPTIGQL